LVTAGAKNLASAAGKRALSLVTDKMGSTAERLTEYASGEGGGLMSAITGKENGGGGNGGGKGKALKVTNILESIDVGVPVSVAYNQWTQFADFPKFMKKVESVEQESDEKLNWTAQVLWSHRSWQSTIVEQVPDKRIVWTSEGDKGTVDGAVTFHELAPDLTRIILNLQYHPKGFVEQVGNIWRAQGRRARLELKHFARQVMNETILHPEETSGWRGEIHEGEVTKGPEEEDKEEQGKEEQGKEEQGKEGKEPEGKEEEQGERPERPRARRAERGEERPRRREERPRRPARSEEGSRRRREPSKAAS